MQIPKTFQLGGLTFTVEYKDIVDNDPSCAGLAIYSDSAIHLRNINKGDYQDRVFLHELIHHILNMMEESELRQNEKFVNLFATFLHQYLKTAK